MKVAIYDQQGKKVKDLELDSKFFEAPIREGLIHLALVRQLSNSRRPIAKTKTKGERRGGGKKPYAQKGTGNARAGSRRSPLWRKGGVTFGPTGLENFEKGMPKSERRQALFSALSAKAKDQQIMGLVSYEGEVKTKNFAALLAKLPIGRKVLIVIPAADPIVQKSARNLANAKVILVNYLNVADLLKYQTVLFLEPAFGKMAEIWKS